MNFIEAAILGIVEGLSEFLPISSTFHLIWTARFLGLPQNDFLKMFEVVIQSGAIMAVIFLYAKEVLKNKSLITKLIFSFIPTALVGYLFYNVIKNVFFENSNLQLVVFIMIGVVFILFEKKNKNLKSTINQLTISQSLIIGLAQSLAVLPGVSRAGAVIVGMMILGYKRSDSAKYSFLLAVPTLFSASLLELYKSRELLISQSHQINVLIVGFLFSFLSAIVVVRWFIKYLQKHDLSKFGIYRIIVGAILIFLVNQS